MTTVAWKRGVAASSWGMEVAPSMPSTPPPQTDAIFLPFCSPPPPRGWPGVLARCCKKLGGGGGEGRFWVYPSAPERNQSCFPRMSTRLCLREGASGLEALQPPRAPRALVSSRMEPRERPGLSPHPHPTPYLAWGSPWKQECWSCQPGLGGPVLSLSVTQPGPRH